MFSESISLFIECEIRLQESPLDLDFGFWVSAPVPVILSIAPFCENTFIRLMLVGDIFMKFSFQ